MMYLIRDKGRELSPRHLSFFLLVSNLPGVSVKREEDGKG